MIMERTRHNSKGRAVRTRRRGTSASAPASSPKAPDPGSHDRIVSIVTTIVRGILASGEDERELENRILVRLASDGHEAADVQEAFRVLGQIMAAIRADASQERGERIVEVLPRVLTEPESLRMSDEAISLFRSWQELRLMTYEETENILQQVMMSGIGDIEAGDLVRIAENVAAQGSSLQLYLASSTGPLQ